MATLDALTARCLAEVERAMETDLEGDDGSGYDAAWETYKRVQPGPHDDDLLTEILRARDKLLALRLARMLAEALRYGGLGWEDGLRAVAHAREAP